MKSLRISRRPGGATQPRADIAESIAIIMRRDLVRKPNAMLGEEVFLAGRMNAQHEHHRSVLKTLKRDIVTSPNFQNSLRVNQRNLCPEQQSFWSGFVPPLPKDGIGVLSAKLNTAQVHRPDAR